MHERRYLGHFERFRTLGSNYEYSMRFWSYDSTAYLWEMMQMVKARRSDLGNPRSCFMSSSPTSRATAESWIVDEPAVIERSNLVRLAPNVNEIFTGDQHLLRNWTNVSAASRCRGVDSSCHSTACRQRTHAIWRSDGPARWRRLQTRNTALRRLNGSLVMWVFLVMKSGHCSEVCPLRITPMKIPVADLVPRVPTMLISEKWQQFWNSCTGNKLQAIKPTVGGHQPKSSLSRRDEVVVNRLRIGHTRCTHSYLLTGEDKPECTTCQCPLTVKHILVDCFNFNDTRNKHFAASSMEELFRTADIYITSLILPKKLILTVSYDF